MSWHCSYISTCGHACVNCASSKLVLFKCPMVDVPMVYSFTGKQHRIHQNNDIYIISEMALVCVLLQVEIKLFTKLYALYLINDILKLTIHHLSTGITFKSFHSDACVTMVTPTGRPYIQKIHDQLGVAIGGNGHCSKCCDEIGHIATEMMTTSSWTYQLPQKAFEVMFEHDGETPSIKSKI